MLNHKVGAFRLLCSSVICVLIGMPVGGFGALQSFMLQRHIYENRCTVSYSAVASTVVEDGIICAGSRAAYTNLYTSSNLGYALAMFPAFFALKYVGYLFSSICCAILLAAGSVVITEPNQDRWGHDKYALGFSLIASAAPFALLNNISTISGAVKSQNSVLICLVSIVSGMQLGPLIWPALGWYINPLSTADELFRAYLWISCLTLVTVLLLMPFSDIVPQCSQFIDLINATKKCFSPATKDTVSERELVPLLVQPQLREHEMTPRSFWKQIPFKLFVVLLLSFLSHSLPLDLMLVSGQVRAEPVVDISVALNVVSPILTMGIIPILFAISKLVTLSTLYLLAGTMCTLNLGLQFMNSPNSWQSAAALIGACRILLLWFLISCSIRCLGFQAYFILFSVFLTGGLISWSVLPSIDHAFVFEGPLLGHNAYIFGFVVQLFSGWWTTRFLQNKKHMARRYALDEEARLAFQRQ